MKVKFYGTRGSIPVAEKNFMIYGGNTACVLVTFDNGIQAILDAGSGLRKLGQELIKKPLTQARLPIILSHTHWDHIQGFPFFRPAYQTNFNIVVYMSNRNHQARNLEEIFSKQMLNEYFPVGIETMKANLNFLEPEQESSITDWGALISVCQQNHPGISYGYRFEYNGKILVYCTDVEHGDTLDPKVVNLARNADLLIHDAHYTPEELPGRKGWGHSSWLQAVEVAQQANVKRLVLFHHNPDYDDDLLAIQEAKCRQIMPNACFARESMEISW
jgi:phosphoribosyl 1,2-cyclic phosphodiesterase